MKVEVSFAMPNARLTVGKEYDTTYVEKKNFLDYGMPYLELIDDVGEPIGWAPCDMEWVRFKKFPTIEDAHGIEGKIPVAMRDLVSKSFIKEFMKLSDFY